VHLTITPHDPLVARDARSFSEGGGARTMEWFNPSVGAGSLRSLLGKLGGGFTHEMIAALKANRTRGPFPMLNEDIFVHRPQDFVARKSDATIFPLRPGAGLSEGEGTNSPPEINLCFPQGVAEGDDDFKPLAPPFFWSIARIAEWLASATSLPQGFSSAWREAGGYDPVREGFLYPLAKDGRTHVQIDPGSGASSEGRIFTTSGLTFLCKTKEGVRPLQMAMHLQCSDEHLARIASELRDHHPVGSERRLANWRREPEKDSLWECPPNVAEALSKTTRVRMLLASPAPFTGGWLPGWLERRGGRFVGTPPGNETELRLVSAVVGRWQPISGWSIEKGKPQGPKALRRMAPAGSVYFFETTRGTTANLSKMWLNSVCDEEQDRRDGFGLALWGIW